MGNCCSNRLIRLEDFETFVPANIKYKPEEITPYTYPIDEPAQSERLIDPNSEIQLENGSKTQDEEESDFLISERRKKEFHERDSEVIFDKKRRIEKDPAIKRVNQINFSL